MVVTVVVVMAVTAAVASHRNSQSLERGPARPGVGGTASMSMDSSHSAWPGACVRLCAHLPGCGLEGGGRRWVRKVRGGVESGWC